ncbi:hypothetical protein ABRZ04_05400 [Castellaniella ginsengisoli]|uniref:Uncharacterized protein n=1 Tax=Castellaniella ginsengisoli TaxID=546114 RepID=A0AB39D2I9_9BURK
MTTKTDITLPPLPQPCGQIGEYDDEMGDAFDVDQMQAYARAAVEADRQGRMPSDEEIEGCGSGGPMSLVVALDFADNPRPYGSLAAPADTNGELYKALRVLATEYRALLSRYGGGQSDQKLPETRIGINDLDGGQFSMRWAVETIYRTFKRDIDQGYKTKDKEFAVSIAGKALEYRPQDGCVSLKLSAPAASAGPLLFGGGRINHERTAMAMRIAGMTIHDAPVAQEPVKRWPFVETPGEFTSRLKAALGEFHDLLPAVRFVLIENPPTFAVSAPHVAAQAQPIMPPLTDSMRAVLRNENDVYGDEDALYAALCNAAEAQRVVNQQMTTGAQDREDAAYQRDVAIGMLAHWVVAIEKNGTGWDDWDEHFKNARFRDTPIRKLLDEAIDAARAAKGGDHG